MYVYYLKQELNVEDGHVFKKGKVMATCDEDCLSHEDYGVVELELTNEQIEKQGFLYIVDGKPFIDDEEYQSFIEEEQTLEQSLQQRINTLEKELNAIKTMQLDIQRKEK